MQEPEPGDTVRQSSCLCYLIAKVRTDERIRLTRDEGWFTDEAHQAVVATAKVRAVRGALNRVRDQVFQIGEDAWIDYRGAVPGDVGTVSRKSGTIEACNTITNIIDEELG